MKRIMSIFYLGLFGATAGAINAALCYMRIPVPIEGDPSFAWHVIPAGAIHGGLLAVVAFSTARAMLDRPVAIRLVVALAVGWCTGYLSWLPLGCSVFDFSLLESLTWPFNEGNNPVIVPFIYFGLVGLLHYLALCFLISSQHPLSRHMLYAIAAGVLGSMWWWFGWKPWYFSYIHGTIYGILVGTGTKIALRSK